MYGKVERGPFAGFAFGPDSFFQTGSNFFRNGQTETAAAFVEIVAVLIKALKHVGQSLFGDADTVVADAEGGLFFGVEDFTVFSNRVI